MARITISNPQNRVKDCYASAPKIDLTLRANGEEKIMVMSALGQWVIAGLEAPTAAAVSTSVNPVSTVFVANKYWEYRYVYVAKRAYPLVENAQTGGGSPAPRSNPSPSVTANSTVDLKRKQLAIPTSQRTDITHIWVYRTEYFDTAAAAADFSEAGNMFWIGEVENNSNVATVSLTDDGSVTGEEQIENDNFLAPIFDKVVYADPYFWGFGNSIFTCTVSLTSTGLVTITDTNKWFDGRNGQTITFVGISTGGYDNNGSYYFKQLTTTTAQLYNDIALTNLVGPPSTGTTTCYIRGQNTVLYRSKPRNPFSWGTTDLIGDLQVPTLYQFPVGGGMGTALAIIANQNLLKLDTEGPTRVYTLNLKNAGTPNFETSLRIISDSYSVSIQQSQFSATTDAGQTVLWGIDTKAFSIVQCDGAEMRPISSMVFQTLRSMSLNETDRHLFHGFYHPRLELNCVLIRTEGYSTDYVGTLVYQHAPTGYWGVIQMMDVLCSAQVFDKFSGQQKIIVGTQSGYVGEAFAENKYINWFPNSPSQTGQFNFGVGYCANNLTVNQITTLDENHGALSFNNPFPALMGGVIGNWITIIVKDLASPFSTKYIAKIASVSANGQVLTFDTVLVYESGSPIVSSYPGTNTALVEARWYIGLIEMEVGRSFTIQTPYDLKTLEEIWTAWIFTPALTDQGVPIYLIFKPTLELNNSFLLELPVSGFQEDELVLADEYASSLTLYTKQTQLAFNQCKIVGMTFRDRNPIGSQLMSYELRFTKADGS